MGGCQCQKAKESTIALEVNNQEELVNPTLPKAPSLNSKFNSKSNPMRLVGHSSSKLTNFINTNDNNKSNSNITYNKVFVSSNMRNVTVKDEGMIYNESEDIANQTSITNKKLFSSRHIDKKEFINSLFFEYNLVRSNPKYYAEKIRTHLQFIKQKNKKFYYEIEDQKVVLSKATGCFEIAIECLSRINPIPLLQLVDDMTPEINKDMDIQAVNDYLKTKSDKSFKYNIDITGSNAETSCVLQLVDDTSNKGARRDNILNPNFRYVSIVVTKGKAKYNNVYVTFSA